MASQPKVMEIEQQGIDTIADKDRTSTPKDLFRITFGGANTFATIILGTFPILLGLSFSSYNEIGIIFSDLDYLFAYFLKLTAFFSFCLFLGILVKRSAFAIGFLFIWNIIEGIIIGLLRWKVFKDSDDYQKITQFLPLESMSNLIKEPFSRLSVIKNIEETIGGAANVKDYGVHWYSLLIVLCWIVIFVLMSYKILKKRDL